MFCYNCMHRISDENNYCPHCGRQSYPDRMPHHLSPGTSLNGRYLIGNAVGEDGFVITYAARDLNIDERVVVREYYPMGHVRRNSEQSNEVRLVSEGEAAYFGKGSDEFIAMAREEKRSGKADVHDLFAENGTAYIVTALPRGEQEEFGARRRPEGSNEYNDGFEGEAPEDYRSQTDIAQSGRQAPPPRKKKGKGGMIAAIVAGSVLVVALAAALIIFFVNGGKSKDDKNIPTTVAVTTAKPEETERPTEAPKTEDNTVQMVDVRGRKLSDAESQLRELGLKIETTREFNDEVAKDYIIRQSAESGQTLRKGDTVMLYVSDGAQPPTTEEPHSKPEFTTISASSTLRGEGMSFSADNLRSNDGSAWAAATETGGEWVSLNANGDQWVNGAVIVNGFAMNQQTFSDFGRVTAVRFEFSDGSVIEKELSDSMGQQTIEFGREYKTNSLKITILGSVPGAQHPNPALSYISIF